MESKSLLKLNLILMLLCVAFNAIGCESANPLSTQNGYHIIKGFGDHPREYQFRNMTIVEGYLNEFPWDIIRNKVTENILNKVKIEYWIHTAVENAELAMVENLELSNLVLRNTIEYPLKEGEIGDNCWESLYVGVIGFIRNNVLVFISGDGSQMYDPKEIEMIARKVDEALISSEKLPNSSFVQAPIINSVEIISALPEMWNDNVTLKVTATDPGSRKLFYRKLANPLAIISEDGILNCSVRENIDKTNDPNKAEVKIWVWNEDNFMTIVKKEVSFR